MLLRTNSNHSKSLFLLFALMLCISCNNREKSKVIAQKSQTDTVNYTDTINVYNFDQLEPLLYTDDDNIHIVNFWAMWCAPCVKELPYIQEYANNHPDIDVLLVSLDFPKDIDSKLKPFLKTKSITNNVVLLDDPDANAWIDRIDPNWSGAIPFTIIFNSEKRVFYERSFENLNDLEQEINKFKS